MSAYRPLSLCVGAMTAVMFLVVATSRAQDAVQPSEKEQQLLAVLASDASPAEKAITCKLLSIHGSSAAVPNLAPLLADPQLASWSRIALEAIPGPEAGEALRSATESLEGNLLIGAINSIGVRRDENAVDVLAARLADPDAEVASAAAVALGRIGNAPATRSLRQTLATSSEGARSAVAEGCILCAERLIAVGDAGTATEIYDEVRLANVPTQRVLEATRGAILARNEEGIPLLLEQFRSPDKRRFQIALSTAREFPGAQVDQALADELQHAAPERAALIVGTMADRPETVILAALVNAAAEGPPAVRLAAVDALARVGDASCLPTLLEVAVGEQAELAAAAQTTLANMPGEAVDARIAELLPDASGELLPVLIQLAGQRRIDALPALLSAADHADPEVRRAALLALGETIDQQRLAVLVAKVLTPRRADDAPIARQALQAASVRMPDREACATQLAAALDQARADETKGALLEILGAVGGTRALETLGAAAKSDDPTLQDVSSRLLGEWMTTDAAPVLLDLTKTAPPGKYQVRALRGYIRIARQFVIPEKERAEMCRLALAAARQPAEQKLVLDVLKRYPNPETLKLAIEAIQIPGLKTDATAATLAIAQNLGGKANGVAEMLSRANLDRVKLEIIKAEYGVGSTQKDVTAIVTKHAGDLPLITLDSTSYNATFGGDPQPGSVKQLKIRYRMNGKVGEATFDENAAILLPQPQ